LQLIAKFHHPKFDRSEVIVLTNKLTNKQTPLKTSTSLRYATPMGNQPVNDADVVSHYRHMWSLYTALVPRCALK